MAFISPAVAQELGRREFPPGLLRRADDLPAGRLRTRVERLPKQAKERAVAWLRAHHVTMEDFASLEVDAAGGIFYADQFELPAGEQMEITEPEVSEASVPVDPFPLDIVFHSKPGAPNVLYLNFTGETVSNTAWNDSEGTATYEALAFSTDSDYSTFSDAERLAIKRVWQRVAEDYAAFDIDVTTERPATFSTRTAHALITRNTDANGVAHPASTAGGVAYLGVFGNSSFARYRPAWIYHNNLGNSEAHVAEAVSHEVGHNLGLSHDGKTTGADYYSGHGSGETSWGPLMGTGYNRNVSQWSKGEYYQANNTQDDLATIAGKLNFRSDDHGNTIASATSLAVAGDGTISSSTPDTDPENHSRANKGILEQNSDADVFSFVSGTGAIDLRVNPWIVPSGSTRGGNVDLQVQLYNAAGQLLLTDNAASSTAAIVQTNLADGVYYLIVKGTGTGNPTSSTPTGYTSYGNVGQYFISGTVIPSGTIIPPGAELAVSDIKEPGVSSQTFTVVYSDNVGVDVGTIGHDDVQVTGPNGFTQMAALVAVDQPINGTPRVATYLIDSPGSAWTSADDGTYTVAILADAVGDTEGAYVRAGALGSFEVAIPQAVYVALMDSDPGWTLSGQWNFGAPQYPGIGPSGGATGASIVGYNLSGNYANRLSATFATTPPINCAGVGSARLRFQRFLRLRSGDTANIQISTNGWDWADLWRTTQTVADEAWTQMELPLPSWALHSTLRIRWGMASGQNQNDIGWNLDDVAVLVEGATTASQQRIVVDRTSISVPEGSEATFSVRLAEQPATNVTIVSTVSGGDTDITIAAGATNIFTPETWNIPMNVTVAAALDVDTGAGVASIQSSSSGLATVYIEATEIELPAQPEITGISNSSTGLRLTISGASSVPHVIEASSDLDSWMPIVTNTPSAGTFFFQEANAGTNRFYRVTVQ